MADRELPPLRVRLIGDDSSYKTMMTNAAKQAEDLAKKVGAAGRKAVGGGKGGGFFNAEEQAIFNRMRLEEQAANIVEKLKFKQMRAQERLNQLVDKTSAKAQKQAERVQRYTQRLAKVEEDRQFRLMLLEEKRVAKAEKAAARTAKAVAQAAKTEQDRLFTLMQLEDKRDAKAQKIAVQAAKAAVNAAKTEEDRIFTLMVLDEKRATRAAGIASRQAKSAARAAKIEEDRLFTLMVLEDKREAKAQKAAVKAAKAAVKAAKTEEDRIFTLMVLEEKRATRAAGIASRQAKAAARAAKVEEDRIFTQMRLSEKFAKQEEKRIFTQMQLKEKADNKALRAQEKAAREAARIAAQQKRDAERQSRQKGGGMGLGGRADIYMASHGIQSISGMVSEPMRLAMDWQDAEISLTAYTGSQEKAKQTLADIKQFALESPYDSEGLIASAKTMMAYGTPAEKTLEIMKNLGAVAGGNSEKMRLLNYGMSQIISTTRLTGYELRQLTESGFNPLMVIAKDMTKTEEEAAAKFVELKKAMEDGRIPAEMVVKALKMVNQEGGQFAGLLDKLNESTRGLLNQLNEMRKNLMADFFVAIQKDLDEYLKTGVAYMQMLTKWAKAHPEAARAIAQWASRILIVVTALLALRMVIGIVVWAIGSLLPLLRFGYMGFMMIARGAIMAWTAILGPYALVVAAIVAIGIAIAALLAYFYHPGGIVGAFGDMMSAAYTALGNTLGFFWNFGENVKIIFDWIGGAWSQMWTNMYAGMRLTWNDISSWLADQMLTVQYMMGGLSAEELIAAQDALKSATDAENNAMVNGVGNLPTMKALNTSMPDLGWTTPKYESTTTPIEAKEAVDWDAMMTKGEEAAGKGGRGAGSSDIAAAARGSSEAEQRARAFMAGNRNVTTGDPKAKREARMERFLRDIEKNTRQPTPMPVANIV